MGPKTIPKANMDNNAIMPMTNNRDASIDNVVMMLGNSLLVVIRVELYR
jgi:hypothetical protein